MSSIKVGNLEIMIQDIEGLWTLNQSLQIAEKVGDGWRLPYDIEMVRYFKELYSLGILGIKPEEAYWAGMGLTKASGTNVYAEGWIWWIDKKSTGWDRNNGNNKGRVRLVRDLR